MKEIARQILEILDQAEPKLMQLDGDAAGKRSVPEKWSKKEILGHLVDSACNNHQRFVRGVYGDAINFTQYIPDEWVRIQRYNQTDWQNLLALFMSYNRHLCHVIECLPKESKTARCNIVGINEPVTLEYIVTDYLKHLKHHLDQILGE